MFIYLITMVPSQCIHVPNQKVVHLKYILCLIINYTSIMQGEEVKGFKAKSSGPRRIFHIDTKINYQEYIRVKNVYEPKTEL